MNEKRIELLWSGGWDSTFMLCKLAWENEAKIQPYYLDIDRPGRKEEHRAMRQIMAVLRTKKDLKGKILPVKIIPQKYYVPSEDVEQAWRKYNGEPYKVGGQYRHIAQFAKQHTGICWGQERYLETPGHMTLLLLDKGGMHFTEDGIGYFVKEEADPDVYTLFGNLVCPIARYSEPMMWDVIRERGYKDVFEHIHFCYYPIDGKPCGMCFPCQTKLKQQMDFLFSDEALACGRVMQMLECLPHKEGKGISDLPELFMMYKNPGYRRDKVIGECKEDDPVLMLIRKKIETYRAYFDGLLHVALLGE